MEWGVWDVCGCMYVSMFVVDGWLVCDRDPPHGEGSACARMCLCDRHAHARTWLCVDSCEDCVEQWVCVEVHSV